MSSAAPSAQMHLAAALDGAGWHRAAWREPSARPSELFSARYWADLVGEAESGCVDFVTIEDSLGLQSTHPEGPDARTDQVRGRLDAVLIAARVAPLSHAIGIVPTGTVSHTEPFHVSKAIATLDYVSRGRAGWRAQLSRPAESAHFGRQPELAPLAERFDEAADFVEVVRRLWDSWEDEAEIRDVTTGRFIDREKVHYVDFRGRWFDVKGPSITPRPPQGQPLVSALAHGGLGFRFAARAADVVFVTPANEAEVTCAVADVRAAEAETGRTGDRLLVFGDLVVFLDDSAALAQGRKAKLDDLDGGEYLGDAMVFAGTPPQLADLLQAWHRAGLSGFRLHPGTLPYDLQAISRRLVPELQRRGIFRRHYEAASLRGLLQLPRPTNRYTQSVALHD
jgi:alkanesulfonate monooxygenase SsuD/methylene tetrahydromethanopterin reductase-like flavin-dependent oxidoreductase (luciferase family)